MSENNYMTSKQAAEVLEKYFPAVPHADVRYAAAMGVKALEKQGTQNDYLRGAKDFIEWLLTNDKYAACTIDTDENKIFSDCGFVEDYWEVTAEELLKEFEQSK